MPIRQIPLFGLLLAATAAQGQTGLETYPLATFASATMPVFVRSSAPALPVDADGGGIFSLAVLGTDLSDLDLAGKPAEGSRGPGSSLARRPLQPATGHTADAAQPDGEDALPVPGRFGRSAVKIPSRFLKDQGIATHTPDVSIDLDKRTSVGLFGEMSHTSRTDTEANLAKPDRELGAGFTLQYKFGTH